MPKAGKIYRIVLDSDKDKPQEKQPYFEFRYLNGREYGERSILAEEIEKSETGGEAIDKLFEIVGFNLVGWGNMIEPESGQDIPFEKEKLQDLLTFSEAREMARKVASIELGASTEEIEGITRLKNEAPEQS